PGRHAYHFQEAVGVIDNSQLPIPNSQFPRKTLQRVVVLLDNIRSLYNTGSILRTADASGVERVVLCGITPRPDQGSRQRRAIAKTALGAENSVPWEYEADATDAL